MAPFVAIISMPTPWEYFAFPLAGGTATLLARLLLAYVFRMIDASKP